MKLPKLEIRKSSGHIYECQEFWDAFSSAVRHNEDLADIDKSKYLRVYLEDSARSVIAGVPSTESSYATAVELLQKRFANPNVIEISHTNQYLIQQQQQQQLAPSFWRKKCQQITSVA